MKTPAGVIAGGVVGAAEVVDVAEAETIIAAPMGRPLAMRRRPPGRWIPRNAVPAKLIPATYLTTI